MQLPSKEADAAAAKICFYTRLNRLNLKAPPAFASTDTAAAAGITETGPPPWGFTGTRERG
jgi:hypothetical protein